MKQLNRQIASAKASMEMEGFVISDEIEELIRKEALGEISEEEFNKQVDKLANV